VALFGLRFDLLLVRRKLQYASYPHHLAETFNLYRSFKVENASRRLLGIFPHIHYLVRKTGHDRSYENATSLECTASTNVRWHRY